MTDELWSQASLSVSPILRWFLIIKHVMAMCDGMMEHSQVEITLRKFLLNFGSILLKVLVIISVASMVGVETTSLIAMLGAAGLAVGPLCVNLAPYTRCLG